MASEPRKALGFVKWLPCVLSHVGLFAPLWTDAAGLLCPWDSGWEVEMWELAVSGVLNGKTGGDPGGSEALEKEAGGGQGTLPSLEASLLRDLPVLPFKTPDTS